MTLESVVEWASSWVPEENRARFAEALAKELQARDSGALWGQICAALDEVHGSRDWIMSAKSGVEAAVLAIKRQGQRSEIAALPTADMCAAGGAVVIDHVRADRGEDGGIDPNGKVRVGMENAAKIYKVMAAVAGGTAPSAIEQKAGPIPNAAGSIPAPAATPCNLRFKTDCPNMKMRDDNSMEGETYDCKVCGARVFLDYEDMK